MLESQDGWDAWLDHDPFQVDPIDILEILHFGVGVATERKWLLCLALLGNMGKTRAGKWNRPVTIDCGVPPRC